jgi:UDP-N-acetylglucosamine acyltransferase
LTAIAAIKRAYKTLYKAGMKLDEARAALEAESLTVPELSVLAGFLVASGRGIVR